MMIVKKQIPLAGPRDRSCGNCRYGDSKLHVCCAKDMMLTDDDLAFYSCGDWEEKINVFTTAENIIGMTPSNPVEVPLQPDGSPKMQAKETIGAETVNTDATVWPRALYNGAEPCKAKLTFQYKESGEERWDHKLEAKALDRGAKQGMTLEALDTVFAIACQQVPSMEQRWTELKGEINVMFAKKWAAEDMPS